MPALRHGRHRGRPVEDLVELGLELAAAQRLPAPLPAEKPAQVEVGDPGGGFLEASSQFDLRAHLVGQFGRNVKGHRFAFHQHGEGELRMKLLALSTAAGGFTALAQPIRRRSRGASRVTLPGFAPAGRAGRLAGMTLGRDAVRSC